MLFFLTLGVDVRHSGQVHNLRSKQVNSQHVAMTNSITSFILLPNSLKTIKLYLFYKYSVVFISKIIIQIVNSYALFKKRPIYYM